MCRLKLNQSPAATHSPIRVWVPATETERLSRNFRFPEKRCVQVRRGSIAENTRVHAQKCQRFHSYQTTSKDWAQTNQNDQGEDATQRQGPHRAIKRTIRALPASSCHRRRRIAHSHNYTQMEMKSEKRPTSLKTSNSMRRSTRYRRDLHHLIIRSSTLHTHRRSTRYSAVK